MFIGSAAIMAAFETRTEKVSFVVGGLHSGDRATGSAGRPKVSNFNSTSL